MGESEAKTIRRTGPRRARKRRRELVVVYSPDESARGRRMPLDGTRYILGRDVEGPGRLDDRALSRRHAAIVSDDAGLYSVEDLGGSNGSFVDGVPVRPTAALDDHQVLSVGETLLVVDLEPSGQNLPVGPEADGTQIESTLIGRSLGAGRLREALATVAAEGTVLLLGETGAGKEVSAQAIHMMSGRAGRLVPVNCAAIPAELAEAELFGHSAGAFTGAKTARDGFLVDSDGGTLFLDEIGDLSLELQAKLLRVLETHEVTPLGGGSARKLDLRVVCATHKDLMSEDFRQDLYARLGDWVLRLPSLAERKVDVLTLWDYFLDGGLARTSPEVAEALLLHNWPMNVRELAKLATRTKRLHAADAEIVIDALPDELQKPIFERFEDVEEPEPADSGIIDDLGDGAPTRDALRAALAAAKGNVKELALANGWHRTQVYRWLRRARLDPKNFR